MNVDMRILKQFPALTFVLFAVLNVPGRLIVDGATKSWFTFSVREPVRSTYNTSPGLVTAQLKRGWPWVFQNEVGYHFVTKDGSNLFLPKPESPRIWQQISIPMALANLVVSGVLVLMLLTIVSLLDRWLRRSHALRGKDGV